MPILPPSRRAGKLTLRHATPLRCLPSIERRGLLCSKSQGRRKVVWLHVPSSSAWAMAHTVRRHGGRIEAVVILEVQVPRSWLRRSRKGLWYSVRDVPVDRIKRTLTFTDLAGNSAA
jgi:hypothetical protein